MNNHQTAQVPPANNLAAPRRGCGNCLMFYPSRQCNITSTACDSLPTLAHLFTDGGYAGSKLKIALLNMAGPTIEIVRRSDEAKGFVVIARRWVVEQTYACLVCRLIASIRRQTRHVASAQKIT